MIWDLLLDSVSDPYFWFILVSVLFVSWWFVSSRFSGPANSPPSPPGSWLLLGHLPAIFKRGGKIYETFTSWSQTLGPVYNVRLFGRDITVVSGYDAVKELFVGCGDAFMDRPDLYIPKTITRGKDDEHLTCRATLQEATGQHRFLFQPERNFITDPVGQRKLVAFLHLSGGQHTWVPSDPGR